MKKSTDYSIVAALHCMILSLLFLELWFYYIPVFWFYFSRLKKENTFSASGSKKSVWLSWSGSLLMTFHHSVSHKTKYLACFFHFSLSLCHLLSSLPLSLYSHSVSCNCQAVSCECGLLVIIKEVVWVVETTASRRMIYKPFLSLLVSLPRSN